MMVRFRCQGKIQGSECQDKYTPVDDSHCTLAVLTDRVLESAEHMLELVVIQECRQRQEEVKDRGCIAELFNI